MTENSDNWEPQERLPWQPKTPREEREALDKAPLATLRATPATREAFMLMGDLAERFPRPDMPTLVQGIAAPAASDEPAVRPLEAPEAFRQTMQPALWGSGRNTPRTHGGLRLMSVIGIFQQLGLYHEGEDGGKCSLRSVT